ncbi:ATP-grasp domain-containing protein, partial [Corynebacterium striatum]
MDLYEYQARDLFEKHGVPTLRGIVATSAVQAEEAAAKLGTPIVVVKAQVKTGGRGKAGGVKLAKSPAEAAEKAEEILGLKIKDHTVRKVMVAEGADIAEEYYFSILLDRTKRRYLAMLSKEGGVEIEKLAAERPEALIRRSFSPLDGMTDTLARDMAYEAGFVEEDVAKLVPVFKQLYKVYTA